jgi:hypothetical protein
LSNELAAYGLGRRVYAFSAGARRWDVLELPEGAEAIPVVGPLSITVENGPHLYVFSGKTGKWTDIDTRSVSEAPDNEDEPRLPEPQRGRQGQGERRAQPGDVRPR